MYQVCSLTILFLYMTLRTHTETGQMEEGGVDGVGVETKNP